MTTMEEFENSLYYLHKQLTLWLEGEELQLKPTLHKLHKQRITTTADMLLELTHSFFEEKIDNKRFAVQLSRALTVLITLIKKHSKSDSDSIFLEYQEEAQTLNKHVIEKTQQSIDRRGTLGASHTELNELLK